MIFLSLSSFPSAPVLSAPPGPTTSTGLCSNLGNCPAESCGQLWAAGWLCDSGHWDCPRAAQSQTEVFAEPWPSGSGRLLYKEGGILTYMQFFRDTTSVRLEFNRFFLILAVTGDVSPRADNRPCDHSATPGYNHFTVEHRGTFTCISWTAWLLLLNGNQNLPIFRR